MSDYLEYSDLDAADRQQVDDFTDTLWDRYIQRGCSCDTLEFIIDDYANPQIVEVKHDPACLLIRLADGKESINLVMPE